MCLWYQLPAQGSTLRFMWDEYSQRRDVATSYFLWYILQRSLLILRHRKRWLIFQWYSGTGKIFVNSCFACRPWLAMASDSYLLSAMVPSTEDSSLSHMILLRREERRLLGRGVHSTTSSSCTFGRLERLGVASRAHVWAIYLISIWSRLFQSLESVFCQVEKITGIRGVPCGPRVMAEDRCSRTDYILSTICYHTHITETGQHEIGQCDIQRFQSGSNQNSDWRTSTLLYRPHIPSFNSLYTQHYGLGGANDLWSTFLLLVITSIRFWSWHDA